MALTKANFDYTVFLINWGVWEVLVLQGLETKGYVVIGKSVYDLRALRVELTDKTYQYFLENSDIATQQANQLFKQFSLDEINSLINNLQKLMHCLAVYGKRESNDE